MIRRPPRSTLSSSSAASDVYKRQVPIAPGNPTVQRGCPTNIGPAAAEDAGYLKCSNDHRSLSESSWFNFGHVLAVRVGETVLTELSQDALGGSWDRACEADGEPQSRGKHCPAEARAGKRIQRFH